MLSQIVALFAKMLLSREWLGLRIRLAKVHRSHINAVRFGPTVLAQQLLISGEDHRFFSHGGIDLIAVCRAIWRSIVLRRPEGASTIEMQVVRVVSGRFERSIRRKVREMALATLVSREIPKSALPAVYLRIGYFGWRMNGFEAACRRLGVDVEALTAADTARLVARLKYPEPQEVQPKRWHKINSRAQHLLRLHAIHKYNRAYLGLAEKSQYESV
ncbi:MAG: transglycosylase domain-containing protein [Candidatus Aminicenantes bacterium]|nr:transglycosylase domain-containing protein [Candidatus Aminicenantes bacterium]